MKRECPDYKGEQTLERPTHEKLFNKTPLYQQRKLRREYTRSTRNTVVIAMLRAA